MSDLWRTRLNGAAWVLLAVIAVALPLPLLTNSSLHHDEALYAHWAQLIAGGVDPWLRGVPVDKPPLFLYTMAGWFGALGLSDGVARLTSLLAHVVAVLLTGLIGWRLYGLGTGLVAGLALALSPFAILFAPTILTDPLLMALVLLGLWGAVQKSAWLAALGAALAVATKQQGLFFAPLIAVALFLPSTTGHATPPRQRQAWIFGGVLAAGLVLPLLWDAIRGVSPGFWQQSSLSYGGVWLTNAPFNERLLAWLTLLAQATDRPLLNQTLLFGLPLLLIAAWTQRAQRYYDWLWLGFAAGFVGLHSLFSFQIWDRYLLPILPLLALLLARVLHVPALALQRFARPLTDQGRLNSLAAAVFVGALLASPVRMALAGGYALGGDGGAYAGAAEVAGYLRGNVGANVTLYHHWLGAHWRYYLADAPYDLRYWETPGQLANFAANAGHGEQYLAFPPWQSQTPARLALQAVGLRLETTLPTYTPAGAPGLFLYRIIEE